MSNFAAGLLAVTEIDGLRRRATAVFIVWLWLHLPVLALVGWLNQTGLVLPLVLAVLFAGAAHAFAWRDPGAPATRYVVAAAFIGMVSLLVRGAAGPWQIDIHMYYFAVFAVLTAYCDARVILLAAALTAVHHLGLNFLLPYAVFPDGGNLWRVILHAGIVIAECGVLIWLCLVLEKLFAGQAESMARMQSTMAEREALEAQAKAEREKFAAAQAAREARFVAAIGEVAKAAAGGDLAQRVTLDGLEGAALQIGTELNRLLEQTAQAVNEVVRTTGAMAAGDVRARAADRFGGRFGELVGDVNGLGDRLSDFAARLEKAAGAVSNASHEIAGSSDDLASRTGQQAESIQRTASAMEEMLATVKQNAGNAQAANQLAAAARSTAEKGGSVVTEAVSAMGRIEEGAQKIADIVGLIDEIAFQTNLLALNASVEAARAGEAGKGFAVVAQEVRALAQRSANASKDIKALIQSSNTQVRSGVDLVSQTGGTLNEIVGAIKKVSDIVAEIAAASGEQAAGLDEVNTAVTRLDEATQQNGALVAQAADAARSLGDQVRQLGEIVGFFRRA